MLYKLKKNLKQFIHKARVGNKCRFGHNVTIDSQCTFAGKNRLADHVTFLNSKIDYASYIGEKSFIKNSIIGRYSCVADNVITIAGNHPTRDYVSIHPYFYSSAKNSGFSYVIKDKYPNFKYIDSKRKISIMIGNDVWIGSRVTILESVKIGDGAIVGAGAVVTKDVPPYAIVGGVPAQIIRYRFADDIRERLLAFQWWNKDENWIKDHADAFENIDSFIEEISQME